MTRKSSIKKHFSIRHAQRQAQRKENKLQLGLMAEHNLELSFSETECEKKFFEWAEKNLKDTTELENKPYPKWLLLDIYKESPLIIAMVFDLITPNSWVIENKIVFINEKTGERESVELSFTLPSIPYSELMEGSEINIPRESGTEKRWMGWNEERENELKEINIPNDYCLEHSSLHIICNAHFKNKQTLDLYYNLINKKKQGVLINFVQNKYDKT